MFKNEAISQPEGLYPHRVVKGDLVWITVGVLVDAWMKITLRTIITGLGLGLASFETGIIYLKMT